ncbi:MAG: hypothetical protein PHU85_18800 [Phycisphaerae bacterium]|nr:hypothetical protein [Phycisphaerae bacterium]
MKNMLDQTMADQAAMCRHSFPDTFGIEVVGRAEERAFGPAYFCDRRDGFPCELIITSAPGLASQRCPWFRACHGPETVPTQAVPTQAVPTRAA